MAPKAASTCAKNASGRTGPATATTVLVPIGGWLRTFAAAQAKVEADVGLSLTSTSPAPLVRKTSKPTTVRPSCVATERGSATVSTTRAICSRRMRRPPAMESSSVRSASAEATVAKFGFTREEQDAYAIESVTRAQAAQTSGAFDGEIVPVKVATRKGEVEVASDEQPGKSDVAKIPTLKPAFKKDGSVTAASSSSISDGAAATVLLSADEATKRGLQPLAKIVGHATYSQAPEWFTTAPVAAIDKLLKQVGWTVDQVDLFEVNEAFAVVAMAPIKELGIPHDKLNVHGGACALGHPIGASGARLVVTLVNALKRRGGKRGVAALCIGGGEATALAIELA